TKAVVEYMLSTDYFTAIATNVNDAGSTRISAHTGFDTSLYWSPVVQAQAAVLSDALSEAIDGAGSEYNSVFAVILGTGVGAGYSVNKQIIVGPNKLTGEWGQNPIPGPMDDYEKSIKRHCGRIGAIEVFLSGPGLENHFEFISKSKKSSREVVSLYEENDPIAIGVMDVYFERIARSFSTFVNILDPDIIVCGGGMSEINDIYSEVPKRIIPYIASNFFLTPIVKATHGTSSGVRGAAHLWN
ncbi:ROK family protein, partial [Acidimicrobiaceae bacterium]|nr:ROK family protein [Acidimicrobiaceae bacterium]